MFFAHHTQVVWLWHMSKSCFLCAPSCFATKLDCLWRTRVSQYFEKIFERSWFGLINCDWSRGSFQTSPHTSTSLKLEVSGLYQLVAFALIYLVGFGGTLQIMSWILCALHLSGKLAPKRAYIGTCWQSASPVHLRIAGADFFRDEVVLVDVETGCLDNLVLSFAAGGSEMYISFIYGCNNVWFGGADLNIRCFCTRVWNKIKV